MFWDSVLAMTAIDLVIIFLTLVALRNIYKNRHMLKHLGLFSGSLIMMSGLILMVMFYVADISIMHVMPMFISWDEAYSFMTIMHLGYNWIISTIGLSLIILSILYFNRTLYPKIIALEKDLSLRASTDSLTRIYNRAKFDEILAHELQRASRYGHSLSLIVFDIDHFKAVNDAYGHLRGDYVLKKVVDLAQTTVRSVDYLARWGGEEFMIILPETELERAETLAKRIKEEIENYDFDTIGKITVSFGVSQFKESDTEKTLIKRTDSALYRAKANGRNRVEVCV
jgi:diguanylate cyclase (GGDEF)-like protein